VAVRRLRGGSSTAVHAIDVQDARGRRRKLVLRRFIRPNWQQPDLPRREAAVLELLRASAVPAPELVAFDAEARECDVPALLMTRLPGRIDLRPKDMRGWLTQMAAVLPRIHEIVSSAEIRPYRPYTDPRTLEPPWWSQRQDAWRGLLDRLAQPAPRAARRFIHRDYHPANLLWSRGKISGVTDWVNASIGSPGIDLGHCRVNLVELYGVEAADRFLGAYLSLLGLRREDHDPYWDAITACDSGFATEPQPFPGWRGLGPKGLTRRIIKDRLDAYAVAIAARC